MQFEEDEIRQSDEDPEFTGAAAGAETEDEFVDDDDVPVEDDDGVVEDDEEETDAAADL